MECVYTDRDELIIKYLPLVKKVVGKIDSKDNINDLDDLISMGVIGLMDAINKYDPKKKVPFEAYATLRIRGSVIDELRKSGRVSRDKIDKLNEYYRAKEDLEKKNLKTPNEDEIMQELGIDERQLWKIHETVHYLSNYSLDSTLFNNENDEISLLELIEDEAAVLPLNKLLDDERREYLTKAIDSLQEREKTILNLYYVEELSLKEIGYILEISIPRVSQIHGKILLKLRNLMSEIMGDKDV